MADAAERAIVDGHHLVVEAGTGVGKSFAYLVPAISYVTAEPPPPPSEDDEEDHPCVGEMQRPRRRVIISTHTISLQEQLLQKDLPLLRSVIPDEFTAVLVKGRGNYLSLRRMNVAAERSVALFSQDEELRDMRHVIAGRRKQATARSATFRFAHSARYGMKCKATVATVSDENARRTKTAFISGLGGVSSTRSS